MRVRSSLVFELAEYGDLYRHMMSCGKVPEEKAKPILIGVTSGLSYIHSHDIVHRDIKTANVLLRNKTCAVITDFGLATKVSDQDQMARRCGTPGFIAPEMCQGKSYGFKVDTFAAGVVLFYMLSGKMPFMSEDKDTIATMKLTVKCELHLRQPPFDTMSSHLRNFLRQLMAKDISKRLAASDASVHSWFARPDRHSSRRISGGNTSVGSIVSIPEEHEQHDYEMQRAPFPHPSMRAFKDLKTEARHESAKNEARTRDRSNRREQGGYKAMPAAELEKAVAESLDKHMKFSNTETGHFWHFSIEAAEANGHAFHSSGHLEAVQKVM